MDNSAAVHLRLAMLLVISLLLHGLLLIIPIRSRPPAVLAARLQVLLRLPSVTVDRVQESASTVPRPPPAAARAAAAVRRLHPRPVVVAPTVSRTADRHSKPHGADAVTLRRARIVAPAARQPLAPAAFASRGTGVRQPAAVLSPVAYLDDPAPAYPAAAKRRGVTGRVMLKVRVGIAGRALAVALNKSSGDNQLDRAAISAVKRWRFIPASRGAIPTEAYILIPIVFRLSSPS